MSNEIQAFNFEDSSVRIIVENGEPLFCASDVCRALGYVNAPDALAKHCDPKGIAKRYTLTAGGNQELSYVNEKNLYRLIMRSKLPSAEKFQDWVCGEVIPTIRKTGKYDVQQKQLPQSYAEALRMLANEVEERERVEKQNALLTQQAQTNAPKVELAEKVLDTQGAYLIRHVAKAIGVNVQFLYQWMRTKSLITQKNEPYADFSKRKILTSRISEYTDSQGFRRTKMTAYVTNTGVMYILNRLIKEGILAPSKNVDFSALTPT